MLLATLGWPGSERKIAITINDRPSTLALQSWVSIASETFPLILKFFLAHSDVVVFLW